MLNRRTRFLLVKMVWHDVDSEKEKNLTKSVLDGRDYYKSYYIENGKQYFIDLSTNEMKKRFDQFDIEELSKSSNSYSLSYTSSVFISILWIHGSEYCYNIRWIC